MILLLQAAPDVGPYLEVAKTLGVGGVLAAGMFLFYRVDRLKSEKSQQDCEKRYTELATTLTTEFRLIVQENTEAMTKLTDMIERR
jgi:hypothetical protein